MHGQQNIKTKYLFVYCLKL